jgi:hypothetical protein
VSVTLRDTRVFLLSRNAAPNEDLQALLCSGFVAVRLLEFTGDRAGHAERGV